jgi:uncharacterized protein YecE (DUF72 family)
VRVWLGTSGWQYRDWRGRFYPPALPQARWLEHYAERFRTVEVNNSFYRLPTAGTFASWRDRTPDDFVFVVKASRYLSHVTRLQEPEDPVDLLVERARHLGDKLGPVLLQLPPTLGVERDRLARTLARFSRHRVRVAVEFRHPSWFDESVFDVLRAHDGPRRRRSPQPRGDHRLLDLRAAPRGLRHAMAALRHHGPGQLGAAARRRGGMGVLQQRPGGVGGGQRPLLRATGRARRPRRHEVPGGPPPGSASGMTVVDPAGPQPVDPAAPQPQPGGPPEPVTPILPDPDSQPEPETEPEPV